MAGFMASCSVCSMMILILIVNTGSIGANMSHNILLGLAAQSPDHSDCSFLSNNPYATIPSGINAMIHRKSTILMMRVIASATSGINNAILIPHLSKNSVTPLRVVAAVLSLVSCIERLEKSNNVIYNVINGQTIPFDSLMRLFIVSPFWLLYGSCHHAHGIKVVCRLFSW